MRTKLLLLLVLVLLTVRAEEIETNNEGSSTQTTQKQQAHGYFWEILEYFVFLLGLVMGGTALITYALSFREQPIVDFTVYSENSRDPKPLATGSMHFEGQHQQIILGNVLHELGQSSQGTNSSQLTEGAEGYQRQSPPDAGYATHSID